MTHATVRADRRRGAPAADPRFAGDISSRGGAAIRRDVSASQPRRRRRALRLRDAAAARCDFRPADTLGHEVVEPRVAAVV